MGEYRDRKPGDNDEWLREINFQTRFEHQESKLRIDFDRMCQDINTSMIQQLAELIKIISKHTPNLRIEQQSISSSNSYNERFSFLSQYEVVINVQNQLYRIQHTRSIDLGKITMDDNTYVNDTLVISQGDSSAEQKQLLNPSGCFNAEEVFYYFANQTL